MRIRDWQLRNMRRAPSKPFSSLNDKSQFSCRPMHLYSTTVSLLQPPRSIPSQQPNRPWIIGPKTTTTETYTAESPSVAFHHPLTLKHKFWNLPRIFDLSKLRCDTIAISHSVGDNVDKLLVVPPPSISEVNDSNLPDCTLLALSNGGQLWGCPRYDQGEKDRPSPWVKLSHTSKFDDIIIYNGNKIYAVDRQGVMYFIHNYRSSRKISIGKSLVSQPVCPGSGRFGWRNRFVADGKYLYLVVRKAVKWVEVYKLSRRRKSIFYWDPVREFEGNKVLFMARNYYFFRLASLEFPGREYKNCIVFSEEAFPQYGNDCWEVTGNDRPYEGVLKSEDEIAVFRLADNTFARVGETSSFPKISWSPPPWIFHDSLVSPDELQTHSASESLSQSESEPGENECLDSNSKDERDEEAQSDLGDSNSKHKEEEGVKSGDDSQNQDQEVMEVDSNSQAQEDAIIQCDSDSQGKEDGEMHSNANIGDDASLQEDASPSTDAAKASLSVAASLSAAEEEATITLLSMSDANGAIEEVAETSRKNVTQPQLSTSSVSKSDRSDSRTTKFEGFDIRFDLVPTLQTIWHKHGNIIENSIIHNEDIVARALESLATMVQILQENSAQSLSDRQADYLTSTLSDLRCMSFKVYWLISFVDKAVQLHKSKSLVDSLNNLRMLSSQVMERRAVLVDELAKLDEEVNKLNEEMAKVSKMVPFYGQVNLDEPLGVGLT